MYKKVLVEINEIVTAEIFARYALKFAKLNNASLCFFFIHKKGIKFEKISTILKRIFLEAEKNHLKAECIIKETTLPFYPQMILKKTLKLPCSVVIIKIINVGKISPKRILFILKGNLNYLKEKTDFIINLSKIFHAKVFINYFGKDENIEKIFSSLKRHEIKFESRIFPKFSYETLIFQTLSKKIELLAGEQKKTEFLGIFKLDLVSKLIENPPCNLIIFKPYHRK